MSVDQAAAKPATTPSVRYLSDFVQLGPQIFWFSADSSEQQRSQGPNGLQSQPDLIIVCAWMYAADRYISKYINPHKSLYPGVPILLLKQDGSDVTWRPNSWQLDNLKPAISVIDKLSEEKHSRLTVLMHLFSNGGAHSACQLADSYAKYSRTAEGNKQLPISALVLDSLPSLPNILRSRAALSEILPSSLPVRLLGEIAIWTFIGIARVTDALGIGENVILSLRRRLNDPKGAFTQGDLRRIYVYSQADKLVGWEEVESHADEAVKVIGNQRVKLEDFKTSRHVGHVMLDEKRYWKLVSELWEDSH